MDSKEYQQALGRLAELSGIDPDLLNLEVMRIKRRNNERNLRTKHELSASKCCEQYEDSILFLLDTGNLHDALRRHLDVERCARCISGLNLALEENGKGLENLARQIAGRRQEEKAEKGSKIVMLVIGAFLLGAFALKAVAFIIKTFQG